MAMTMFVPFLLSAGNIPQYQVSKGTNTYAEFTDGTPISVNFNIDGVIFADDKQSTGSYTGAGFPIGFNFRYAGQIFDCFALSSYGNLYLGANGEVAYEYGADSTNFRIGMVPNKFGLYSGSYSYKTEGEEGARVFTLQLVKGILNEPNPTERGKYSLQIRLYENDGKIEIAFEELETCYANYTGFDTGLHGWEDNDTLWLYADGLDKEISISPWKMPSSLETNSYIRWKNSDYMKMKTPVYVFDPVKDKNAPLCAPENLNVTQKGATLFISCDKASGSDATVLLYSTSPLNDADYPIDGETFKIGNAVFGNATPLYYGNDDAISLEITELSPATTYYFAALSANGYPAYNRTDRAEVSVRTSQVAPTSLEVTSVTENTIGIKWTSEYPVIVAQTNSKLEGYLKGYVGQFGQPTSNAKPGDLLEEGGEIVYVGDGDSFIAECNPNELTFFRTWSVFEETVSSTSADTYGISSPVMPYEPNLEYYPFYEQLQIWNATPEQFLPFRRAYQDDEALRAYSINSNVVTLATPELPLSTPVRVTFEFALETVLPADDNGVPMGNKPGVFGSGGLSIEAGGQIHKTVNTYNGTMQKCPDGYEEGSSSYEAVEVDIPAVGADEVLTFRFSAGEEETSYLYLRNIKIERTAEVPKAPESTPTSPMVDEDKSAILHFSCVKGMDAQNTLVLFSENPITASDYPKDGIAPIVGSKVGNAYVLYYGPDEKVDCETDYNIVIADYGTTYYFAALSASENPLYNRDNVTAISYTTMKEAGNATIDDVSFDECNMTISVKAIRHTDAASTLILLSEGNFNSSPEDGRVYAEGETLGNSIVLYHGDDSDIELTTDRIEPNREYVLTAISSNERGWWSDMRATTTFSTEVTIVEPIAPACAPTSAAADENRDGSISFSCVKGEDAAYTLVIFSERNITDISYPTDGAEYKAGDIIGNATVLYFGHDDDINCQTEKGLDAARTYYFMAFSASDEHLFNRDETAELTYTTLPPAGNAVFEEVSFDEDNMSLTVKATRHEDAASTLILISENAFDGIPEDETEYTEGDALGNAIVLYHGEASNIDVTSDAIEPNKTYILTAISSNERGWWSDSNVSISVSTIVTGVGKIDEDFSKAEIYDVMGIRMNVNSIEELSRGIYIINGKKTVIIK